MLKAIFYARFHPERGPSVIHQYPRNSIIASETAERKALISYSDARSYIIPPYEICNRPLSVCADGYRVLGFPVSLYDPKYERYRFTFNVCFVLEENEDYKLWDQVIRKTAAFFRAMEEEDGILQTEEELAGLSWAGETQYPAQGVGVVYAILENIVESLNAYRETCVRVNEYHVLNLRLTPSKLVEAKVRAWDVPLLIRPLPDPDEWTWDVTLQRIHSHIDGVKHVQRIAELADVELKLVQRAVRELLYHERALILDIFHFQAVYCLTANFSWFIEDEEMQEGCCRYVEIDPSKSPFASRSTAQQNPSQLSKHKILSLYRDLGPGVSVQDFCLANEGSLSKIDVRRFITFGILKGFLRRRHKHILAVDSQSTTPQQRLSGNSLGSKSKLDESRGKDIEKAWKKAALSSGWATPSVEEPLPENQGKGVLRKMSTVDEDRAVENEKLMHFLDGKHCMDEICVAMHMSEKKVLERVRNRKFGEIIVFCK